MSHFSKHSFKSLFHAEQLPGKQSHWWAVPTGTRQGQESHAYLGMCLLLAHKTVSRHSELGHACVPQIFDQCPDGVCFGNVVRSAEDTEAEI